MAERINKYLRDRGFASRREADELVANGEVFINGVVAELGSLVQETDNVEVRRKSEKRYEYRAYYKPRGLATQAETEEDVISLWKPRGLYPIGRLDKESEGLLLLTNDGRLTTTLLGPESETEKEYEVQVREELRGTVETIFEKGMSTESLGTLLPAKAQLVDAHTLRITLVEGKKHQIRIMLSDLGYTIESLKRIRVGPVTLGDLMPSKDRALSEAELSALKLAK